MFPLRASTSPQQTGIARPLRVFFSYSRKNMIIADRIVDALENNGIEVLIDRRSLTFSAEWQLELISMIQRSDKVLWLVSEHSVTSKWCRWELDRQSDLEKQLIPIKVGDISGCDVPRDLSKLHMQSFMPSEDFDSQIPILVQTLSVSQDWVKLQTGLEDRAAKKGSRLRGAELNEAEAWLLEQPDSEWLRNNPDFAPKPTKSIKHLIAESRRLADRNKNWTLAASFVGTALAIGIALTSYTQWRGAQIAESRSLAVASSRTAEQGDAASALLLALKGLPEKLALWARPVVADLQSAIYRSLFSLRERQVFEKHEAPLTYAEISPDGRWVLTSSEDGSARLWNLENGQPTKDREGSDIVFGSAKNQPINRAVFSPDASRIVTVSDDHSGHLFDINGHKLATLKKHTQPVSVVSFSDDGDTFVTAGADYKARLWSAQDGEYVREFKGHRRDVIAATFSPDGSMLATASADKTARLWPVHEQQDPIILENHRDRVLAVTFDPTGALVATASRDDRAIIWTSEGNVVHELIGHDGDINRVRFAPSAPLVITASDDNTAKLWNIETGDEIDMLSGHGSRVIEADFSADGTRILTASVDGAIGLWRLLRDGPDYRAERIAMLRGHERDIVSAQFSQDGEWIISASKDHTARLWQASEGQSFADSLSHPQDLRHFAFSPGGKRILTASKGGLVRIWDASTHEILNEKDVLGADSLSKKERVSKQIIATAFSHDGALIALAHEGGAVSLHRPLDGMFEQVGEDLLGHKARVRSIDFSSDDKRLVTASADSTVNIWQWQTGEILTSFARKGVRFRSAAFSPDDAQILTVADDRAVRILDSTTGALISEFIDLHEDDVWGAGFSPDGKEIVTGSEDGQAFITTLANRQSRQLVGHGDNIRSAEFSRDGRYVLTSSWDRTVRLWDAETAEELAVIPSEDIVLSAAFDPSGRRIAHLMKNLVRFRPIYPTLDELIKAAKESAPRLKTREERQIDAKGQDLPGPIDRFQGLISATFSQQ